MNEFPSGERRAGQCGQAAALRSPFRGQPSPAAPGLSLFSFFSLFSFSPPTPPRLFFFLTDIQPRFYQLYFLIAVPFLLFLVIREISQLWPHNWSSGCD